MLIEDKFIYISLPRCGSTSFHYTCLLDNLNIKTLSKDTDDSNLKVDFKNINESHIMDLIMHGHETITDLQYKFGTDLPIIAVNRDRHERFYSLYKHCVFDLYRCGAVKVAEFFKTITLDDLFFFKTEELLTYNSTLAAINKFLLSKNLITKELSNFKNMNIDSEEYVVNIIWIMLTPYSYWHNHNPNIIWFDIDNLSDMNEWVSSKIEKPFKIKKVNSSKHIETNLKLDTAFKNKYNNIYNYYDLPKLNKSMI